jgi:glutathione S-transferase
VYGVLHTPYTEKVLRALRWKRLPHALVEPTRAADFARWSPKTGLLPVLELDGERTPDSNAILDVLEARFPDPPLLARDPKTARDQRALEAWVGETFSFYLLRWLRARLGPEAAAAPREGGPLGPFARLGLLGEDGRLRPEAFDTRDGGPGPEFARKLADLEGLLGHRPFFHADALSRADLAVFGFTHALAEDRYTGSKELMASFPGLAAHADRVDAATPPLAD